MDAAAQAVRDVQSDNPYYRVTRWVLPAGATTGEDQDEHRATTLPSATGQLLLKKQDGEQHMEAFAGQPLEIEPGVGRELFNTSEHELSFTMIESSSFCRISPRTRLDHAQERRRVERPTPRVHTRSHRPHRSVCGLNLSRIVNALWVRYSRRMLTKSTADEGHAIAEHLMR